ncbi:AraC family transcriptional regulator [Hoeflea sp. BAL378]|uniref:AraC family transcriptional regulator n=1 Tax=Hoeflea sp. BAL378 TaxID=1547437 RepID=UPI00068EAC17|nr:AraC family transcriptional regulator [Hoeflea sp. BAL378]
MDIYSEVFSALRLEAGLYFRACLRGDFALRLAEEQRRIRFHLVLDGACFVTVPGQDQVRLARGDFVLIPDGAAQTLSSGRDVSAAVALSDALSRAQPVDGEFRYGAGDPLCRLLCGFLRFDEALDHPLLKGLPPLIVLQRSDDPAAAGITAALALLRAEADGPGAMQASIIHRVVEILLMQTVRSGLAGQAAPAALYSAALAHPRLFRALSAIHSRPEAAWTVDSLAAVAGMSRSRFAQIFTRAVGMTPVGYLTHWRMIRARELLAAPGPGMADIAARCGYLSVPAFGRRFAATFGIGPGEWRRRSRSSAENAGEARANPKP